MVKTVSESHCEFEQFFKMSMNTQTHTQLGLI